MSLPYAAEKEVAIAAVIRACSLTSSVFNKLVKGESLSKEDKSPVTGMCALSAKPTRRHDARDSLTTHYYDLQLVTSPRKQL